MRVLTLLTPLINRLARCKKLHSTNLQFAMDLLSTEFIGTKLDLKESQIKYSKYS